MTHPYQTPSGWCGDPKRGASMGRTSDLSLDTTATLHLRRVPLDEGGYDPGGAYWGTPHDLFIAEVISSDIDNEEGATHYLRARSIEDARAQFPRASFATPNDSPTDGDLADMLDGYLTAALWSTNDNSDESGGDPLDSNYNVSDIADETAAKLRTLVETFARDNAATLRACIGKRGKYGHRECDWSLAGHDLWLTSNGHGAGFWDGGWPEAEDKVLTDAAHKVGEVNLYVGDDGKIYG